MKRHRRQFLAFGVALVDAAWIIGRIFGDASLISSPLFYIPSPMIAVVNLVFIAIALRQRQLMLGMYWFIIALLSIASVGVIENHWTSAARANSSNTIRLVHWNVYWGKWGWNEVQAAIASDSPDIVALSEVPSSFDAGAFMTAIGAIGQARHEGTLGIFVKGQITDSRWVENTPELKVLALDCHIRSESLHILIADIPASLKYARDPILTRLSEILERENPDILVGDLNSPRQSRALKNLPAPFRHAYDLAGSGWSYTWPMPLPMLAIDHCIVGPRVVCDSYELKDSLHSDHRRQFLSFSLKKFN